MQCVTSTGRLSSRNPNFQNQPRAKTFPIRKVINSRFENGKIMEIDFAQLEFRTAVFLSQDKQGMEDIKNGVDVHQYTADIIGCSRQEAKAQGDTTSKMATSAKPGIMQPPPRGMRMWRRLPDVKSSTRSTDGSSCPNRNIIIRYRSK